MNSADFQQRSGQSGKNMASSLQDLASNDKEASPFHGNNCNNGRNDIHRSGNRLINNTNNNIDTNINNNENRTNNDNNNNNNDMNNNEARPVAGAPSATAVAPTAVAAFPAPTAVPAAATATAVPAAATATATAAKQDQTKNNNPYARQIKRRPKHVLISTKSTRKQKFDPAALKLQCKSYILMWLAPYNCTLGPGQAFSSTKCTCMKFLSKKESADILDCVCDYMVHWAGMDLTTKQEVFGEWFRFARHIKHQNRKNIHRVYFLPTLERYNKASIGKAHDKLVCRNAILNLLNIHKAIFDSCVRMPVRTKPHSLTGRKGDDSNAGRRHSEVRGSMHDFFKTLIEENQSTTITINNKEFVVLPPGLSKHYAYTRWCWERGWVVRKTCTTKTDYGLLEDQEKRPHDDDEDDPQWPTGSESKQIVTWTTFRRFWAAHYPNLKIHSSVKSSLSNNKDQRQHGQDGDDEDDGGGDDEDDDDDERYDSDMRENNNTVVVAELC